MKTLKTSEIARAVGVHPNTIRLYEEWGLLPPIPRTPAGYRQYTQAHLEQVKLIRLTLHCTVLGGAIRKTAYRVIELAARGEHEKAQEQAYRHLEMVKFERAQAELAVDLLKQWVPSAATPSSTEPLSIANVAEFLGVTIDMLRNWERNGLIAVPRDPVTGYRLYGRKEINRLRIIRTLRRAKYGTMSILRMMRYLDAGGSSDLKQVLDTPGYDEDVLSISDRWLSALGEIEDYAHKMIIQLQYMINE